MNRHPDDPGHVDAAVARAVKKLDELRAGVVVPAPAGRFRGRVVGGLFLMLLGVLCLAGAIAIAATDLAEGNARDDEWVAAILLFVLALAGGLPGLYLAMRSKASTPERAVKLFFRSVGRGGFAKARRLVVPNDFDGFARLYPDAAALGQGSVREHEFDAPGDFENYWNGLVRYHTAPYCMMRFRNMRTEEYAPDLAVVRFDLTATMNTQLWFLFILLGCIGVIVALIVDAATRKSVTARMQKIVYRVGDEWHILNGEWQGPEEEEVGWL